MLYICIHLYFCWAAAADFAFHQVFAESLQNVPKLAGKLWSLIVKTLNFDWLQNMFFSQHVWAGSCKRWNYFQKLKVNSLKNHEGVFRQLQNVDAKAQGRNTNFLRELITCISWPLHELIPIFVYVIHLPMSCQMVRLLNNS